MVGISQIVSMIPAGLPVAITVALAVGVHRMAVRRAIVRKLSAVESLGSTNVICTDKTGTLTRNEMTVREIFSGGQAFTVSGGGYAPDGAIEGGQVERLESLMRCAVLCNDSRLLPPEGERQGWSVLGDPTEGALLTVARKSGLDVDRLQQELPRTNEIPFDSSTKYMATEHDLPDGPLILLKGAPERLLEFCGLTEAEREQLLQAADAMASRALRVLAFAEIRGKAWARGGSLATCPDVPYFSA
jgi:magnesium-transporting ATPase (P-type)